MAERYIVYGVDASYFTQKVLGLFAYKEIPTDYRKKTLGVRDEVEARSGTRLMPVVVTPEGEWLWDSTPIAFEMDRRFPASALLPEAPVRRIAARILEDFFDEWPTRHAVHFRWLYEQDIAVAGESIGRDLAGVPQEGELDEAARKLADQAIATVADWGRRTAEAVGAGSEARAEIENDWIRLVELLEQHLSRTPFLLGPRPSLPDFALFGGLHAHFLFDPRPKELTTEYGPAVVAYRDRVAQARASRAEPWPEEEDLPETLAPLFQHVAMGFHRFLGANRAALEAGENTLELDLGHGPRRMRARRYSEKTRSDTAKAIAALSVPERERAEDALGAFGVLDIYCD